MTEGELEGIDCYYCGTIKVQLYLNHEVNNYAYRQVTCMPCYKKWLKERIE